MRLGAHDLAPAPGSVHNRKRVGRGNGSGHGTYSGRGIKGQKSRSGPPVRTSFEGGQSPLTRKLHVLRGFNNKWKVSYQPVNLSDLERFDEGTEITPELLRAVGIVKHLRQPVKILASGTLTRKLDVSVHRFSQAARQAIEAAGGKATEIDPRPADTEEA